MWRSWTPFCAAAFWKPFSRETVGDGNQTATYSYLANSPLVDQITFDQSGTNRMTSTKAYDYANRLTSMSHADGQSAVLASYAYGYNAANQRTNVTHADSSSWTFGYDDLGQVSSGKKRNLNDLLFPDLQYEYDYDDIGNRTQTRTGGDASGNNLRTANYSPNRLNQYTQRDVPGFVEVQGSAVTNATVTVNRQASDRLGGFYRRELFVDNSQGPVAPGLTNVAVIPGGGAGGADLVSTETGSRKLGQTPERLVYDTDGNTLSDGLWNYLWNGENRLVELTSNTNLPAGERRKLVFTYDHQGRRNSKAVYNWNGSTLVYDLSSRWKFVYDGWNLVAELDGNTNLVHGFTWGLDLSDSGQGAGGVGGLLLVGTTNGVHVAGHDGNGNVSALVSASDATVTARYEYSPFGRVVRATGQMALVNPIRFSTKYPNDETGLNYYGLRFYNPDTGRWLNPDPIAKTGGANLYHFVMNNPIHVFDTLGLYPTIVGGNPGDVFTYTGSSTVGGVVRYFFVKYGDPYVHNYTPYEWIEEDGRYQYWDGSACWIRVTRWKLQFSGSKVLRQDVHYTFEYEMHQVSNQAGVMPSGAVYIGSSSSTSTVTLQDDTSISLIEDMSYTVRGAGTDCDSCPNYWISGPGLSQYSQGGGGSSQFE